MPGGLGACLTAHLGRVFSCQTPVGRAAEAAEAMLYFGRRMWLELLPFLPGPPLE